MGISPFQIVLILLVGVLIFGKNLPDVARRIGLGLMEFKKGLNEMNELSKGESGSFRKKAAEADDLDHEQEETEKTEKYEVFGAKFDF